MKGEKAVNTQYLLLFSDGAEASVPAEAQSGQPQELSVGETAENGQTENAEQAPFPQPLEPCGQAENELSKQDLDQLRRIAEGKMRMQDWQTQGERLKVFYPSFSFQQEYDGNEDFAGLLRAGVSVRQAYEVTHLPQILTSAMQYAAKKAAEKTASAMRSAAVRPQENGLSDRKAGFAHEKGVDSLTQADIIRILERVGKGDKITF